MNHEVARLCRRTGARRARGIGPSAKGGPRTVASNDVVLFMKGRKGMPQCGFSMQVDQDDSNDAWPAIRHIGGANIVFLDGHAANIKLKPSTIDHTPYHNATSPGTLPAKWMKTVWASEWVDNTGKELFPISSTTFNNAVKNGTASQNMFRYPEMPLRWSDPDHGITR